MSHCLKRGINQLVDIFITPGLNYPSIPINRGASFYPELKWLSLKYFKISKSIQESLIGLIKIRFKDLPYDQ